MARKRDEVKLGALEELTPNTKCGPGFWKENWDPIVEI